MFVNACPKYYGFLVQNHLPKFGDFIIDCNDCNKKKKKRTKNSMVIVLIEICFSTLQDDIKAKWSKPLP